MTRQAGIALSKPADDVSQLESVEKANQTGTFWDQVHAIECQVKKVFTSIFAQLDVSPLERIRTCS